eukprot:360512-Chlamydomonas_euryale.AAC.4
MNRGEWAPERPTVQDYERGMAGAAHQPRRPGFRQPWLGGHSSCADALATPLPCRVATAVGRAASCRCGPWPQALCAHLCVAQVPPPQPAACSLNLEPIVWVSAGQLTLLLHDVATAHHSTQGIVRPQCPAGEWDRGQGRAGVLGARRRTA